jgi:hypothetical protein
MTPVIGPRSDRRSSRVDQEPDGSVARLPPPYRLIALLFWWLGLFRNSEFPSVPTSLPWSMLLVVPLALGGFWLYRSFDPTFFQGRVIAVKGDAPTREVTVRLSNGMGGSDTI